MSTGLVESMRETIATYRRLDTHHMMLHLDALEKLLSVVEAAEDLAYCEVECGVCSGCKLRKALDEVTG